VHALQATALGVSLDAPIPRAGELGSPLGNLFADALRDAMPDADAAIVSNASRGLRADLPAGVVTLGRLYDVFPFDNRVVRIALTAAELREWLAAEIRGGRRDSLGISGFGVRVTCAANGPRVALFRASGAVHDDERLIVVTIAYPTLSGNLASFVPSSRAGSTEHTPVVREAVENWVRRSGARAEHHVDAAAHRVEYPDERAAGCAGPNDVAAQRQPGNLTY
jgi:2',3'-cyclic-nucleotide 2'-phosphodiesterase (5'-nucleotidase family)